MKLEAVEMLISTLEVLLLEENPLVHENIVTCTCSLTC